MLYSLAFLAIFPVCDIDLDGDIDFDDINLIAQARNTYTYIGDPRDFNQDGLIAGTEANSCVSLCTRPSCRI